MFVFVSMTLVHLGLGVFVSPVHSISLTNHCIIDAIFHASYFWDAINRGSKLNMTRVLVIL